MATIALAFLIPSALLASLIANGVSAGYAGGAALPSGIRTGSSEPGRSSGPLAAGDNEWRNALPPPPTLEARWAHAMAYDLESDRVLLFGGATLSGPMSDQTWAYNPATNQWADMSPSRRPSLREGMGLAYDAESDRVVLFGGGNHYTNVYNDETWSYDYNTNTWTNMNPAVRPSARADMQIAYDGQSDRMVLFGGATTVTNNAPLSYPVGTNFVTWTVRDASGNTASCVQTVIVADSQPPTITCPPLVTVADLVGSVGNSHWNVPSGFRPQRMCCCR